MTSFAALRRRIGWSALEAGRRLGLSERTARRLEAGEASLNSDKIMWMKQIAEAIESVPPLKRATTHPDA